MTELEEKLKKSLDQIIAHPSILNTDVQDLRNESRAPVVMNDDRKGRYACLKNTQYVAMLPGDVLPSLPLVSPEGYTYCKRTEDKSYTYFTMMGIDKLIEHYTPEFRKCSLTVDEEKLEQAKVVHLLCENSTGFKLKDSCASRTKTYVNDPLVDITDREAANIVRKFVRGLAPETAKEALVMKKIKDKAVTASKQLTTSYIHATLSSLRAKRKRVIFTKYALSNTQARYVPRMHNFIHYEPHSKLNLTSIEDNTDRIRAEYAVLNVASKAKWGPMRVLDAARGLKSITGKSSQAGYTLLQAALDLMASDRCKGQIDFSWGIMEWQIPTKTFPVTKAFVTRTSTLHRPMFVFEGRTAFGFHFTQYGSGSIEIEEDKLLVLRLKCDPGRAVEFASKVIALFGLYDPPNTTTRTSEWPFDPFFEWKRVKNGGFPIRAVERECFVDSPGPMITDRGVVWSTKTDNRILLLPRPVNFFGIEHVGVYNGSNLFLIQRNIHRGENRGIDIDEETFTYPPFCAFSGPDKIPEGYKIDVGEEISLLAYARQFQAFKKSGGLESAKKDCHENNFLSRSVRQLSKFVTSTSHHRAIAQHFLRHSDRDADYFVFLPYAGGPLCDLKAKIEADFKVGGVDGKAWYADGAWRSNVDSTEDGRIFVQGKLISFPTDDTLPFNASLVAYQRYEAKEDAPDDSFDEILESYRRSKRARWDDAPAEVDRVLHEVGYDEDAADIMFEED